MRPKPLPQKLKDKIYNIKLDFDSKELVPLFGNSDFLVRGYQPDEREEELAKAYAEAIREGTLTDYSSVQWKAEIGVNLFAVYSMLNIILDKDRCIQLLRAIIKNWCPRGIHADRFKNKPLVKEFLDKLMDEIHSLETDDDWLTLCASEYYPALLRMFKKDKEILRIFIDEIRLAQFHERQHSIVCEHVWYLMKKGLLIARNNREIYNVLHGAEFYGATETAFNNSLLSIDRKNPHNDFTQNPVFKRMSQIYQ